MRALMFLLFTISMLSASTGDSLFLEANRLYDAQKYDSASTLYSEAIKSSGESSVLYYNLGNCSYRMGRVGEAILYKSLKYCDSIENTFQ